MNTVLSIKNQSTENLSTKTLSVDNLADQLSNKRLTKTANRTGRWCKPGVWSTDSPLRRRKISLSRPVSARSRSGDHRNRRTVFPLCRLWRERRRRRSLYQSFLGNAGSDPGHSAIRRQSVGDGLDGRRPGKIGSAIKTRLSLAE